MVVRTLCAFIVFFVTTAGAMGEQQGRVKMTGTLVATACSISSESLEQVIDLGSMPISELAKNGQGPEKEFVIKLENCELTSQDHLRPDFKSVHLTFDGTRDEIANLLSLQGEASGIGLVLKDEAGNIIVPGQNLPDIPLNVGSMVLNYKLAIQRNNHELRAGNYRAIVKFKVEYL